MTSWQQIMASYFILRFLGDLKSRFPYYEVFYIIGKKIEHKNHQHNSYGMSLKIFIIFDEKSYIFWNCISFFTFFVKFLCFYHIPIRLFWGWIPLLIIPMSGKKLKWGRAFLDDNKDPEKLFYFMQKWLYIRLWLSRTLKWNGKSVRLDKFPS